MSCNVLWLAARRRTDSRGGCSEPDPLARIVNVKVGIADGGVDVTQVIATIDWVVQHKNDPGLNIRVLNLSYGTNSMQASGVDPLSFAVEQAWKKGIVVVASAGKRPSWHAKLLALSRPGPPGNNGSHERRRPDHRPHALDHGRRSGAP